MPNAITAPAIVDQHLHEEGVSCQMHVVEVPMADRAALARRGKLLEVLTILWAATEASVALWAAHRDGSISLAGFGWDSCIEVLSGIALYWRMTHEMDHARKHRAEELSARVAGVCLFALSAYVLTEAVLQLVRHQASSPGLAGIVITTAALVLMPVLTHAKRKVARGLNSRAMMADAAQTNFCAIQAAIVLAALLVHSVFGIWWIDAAAGLVLVPFLLRAGRSAMRGEACCH